MTGLGYERKSAVELERRLHGLLDGDGPVVVGPWLAEIGHELLHWVPFLRWIVERFEVDPTRMTVVSRGGVHAWYDGIASSYVDIFSSFGVDEYRRLNERRWAALGGMKQGRFTYWDRLVLERAAGWDGRAPVLHPAYMFRFLRRYGKGGLSLAHVLGHLRFRRLEPPPLPAALAVALPDEYVVAAFYFRASFEGDLQQRALVSRIVDALAEETTVVLLDADIRADEHEEAAVEPSERVLRPLAGAAPAENLGLQTAVAARARAWVGTYGGRSYIAPTYGVPCISFTDDRAELLPAWDDVLRRLAHETGTPYTLLETSDLDLLTGLAPVHAV